MLVYKILETFSLLLLSMCAKTKGLIAQRRMKEPLAGVGWYDIDVDDAL